MSADNQNNISNDLRIRLWKSLQIRAGKEKKILDSMTFSTFIKGSIHTGVLAERTW